MSLTRISFSKFPSKDLLHEGSRHLPGILLLHGVRCSVGVCDCHLQQQEDKDESEEAGGVPEDSGGDALGAGKEAEDGAAVGDDRG